MKKSLHRNFYPLTKAIGFALLIFIMASCQKEHSVENLIPEDNHNDSVVINTDSVYVNFTVNASHYFYLYPTDSVKFGYGVYQNQDSVYLSINAFTENPQTDVLLGFSFNKKNIMVGSSYQMTDLLSIPDLLPASYLIIEPVMVHITELGAPGQYIKGSFSGLLQSKMVPDLMLNVSGNFRVPKAF